MNIILYVYAALMLLMSLVAFAVYAYDKAVAGTGKRRIPEITLLLLAAALGGVGAYIAMKSLRHKTQHRKFVILVPIFAVVQVVLPAVTAFI